MGSAFYPAYMKECRSIWSNTKKEYLFDKRIPLREKVAVVLSWLFPRTGAFVFKSLGN